MSDSKKIKLRVTRRHHTVNGKKYGPGQPDGDTFMGTEKMLQAMPDRLQLASAPVGVSADASTLAEAEKGRDLYKAAADEAQKELGEVKEKLAAAEAELTKLKAPAGGMPSPGAKGSKNADTANGK